MYKFWHKLSVEKTSFEKCTRSQHNTVQLIIRKCVMDIWTGLISFTILSIDGINTSVCKRSRWFSSLIVFLKYSSAIYKVEVHFLNYSFHNLITKEPYAQDTVTTVPLCILLDASMYITTRSAEPHILDLFNLLTYLLHGAESFLRS